MSKEMSELVLPDDVRYTHDHEWAKQEDDNVKVGITDYAQDQLGDIVFVELPQPVVIQNYAVRIQEAEIAVMFRITINCGEIGRDVESFVGNIYRLITKRGELSPIF